MLPELRQEPKLKLPLFCLYNKKSEWIRTEGQHWITFKWNKIVKKIWFPSLRQVLLPQIAHFLQNFELCEVIYALPIFLSICKCVLPIHDQTIIDYRLKCQFEQLIFFRTSKFFDWSVTDKEELRLWIFRRMEIYTRIY